MKSTLILTALWLIGAASKEMRMRSRPKSESNELNNMCDLKASDGKNIRCFCVQERYPVSTAECWIFGPIVDEHFMWRLIVSSQPFLTEFNLMTSNQTRFIPSHFFEHMLFLKNFSVSLALLERLEKFAFGNSTSLESLKLAKNQIEHLDQFSLSQLTRLKHLDLQKNRIRTIKRFVFFNTTELKYIRLNSNNIIKVEDKAFESMGNVLEMDLSENYLCDINNLTFFGLSKLKVIDLSANRIIKLESSVFSEMWDVENPLSGNGQPSILLALMVPVAHILSPAK
nr:negative regulator of reactive oxygen species-like [Leptinotarsa decemlineata]